MGVGGGGGLPYKRHRGSHWEYFEKNSYEVPRFRIMGVAQNVFYYHEVPTVTHTHYLLSVIFYSAQCTKRY